MHISKLVDYVKNKISFSKEFCEDNAFVTLRIEPILKILENLEQSHKDILEYVEKIEKYKYLYQKALDNTIQADKENIQLKKQIDLMAEDWFFKEGYKLQIYIQRNRTDDRIFRKKRIYNKSI